MNTTLREDLDGGRRLPPSWKGWRAIKPGYHKKRVMFENCGRKCFLDPPYRYPICQSTKTCKINRKGLMSAYIRARQYHNKRATKKARNMIRNFTKVRRTAVKSKFNGGSKNRSEIKG